MSALALALAAFLSTLIGGAFALRFTSARHLILGFTAGVLLGVVGFDVLPELFTLTRTFAIGARAPMAALVTGFLVFRFLLHIGAADILPEAHSERSSGATIGLTAMGTAFAFVVSWLAP